MIVTFQGDTATATATISGGKVTGITITDVGSDYQSAPSAVTIAAPSGTGSLNLASGSVLVAADDEIVIPSAMYAVISTGEAVTYSDGGGTAPTGLVDGTVYFLIKSGTANKISLATTYANAVAGTKITYCWFIWWFCTYIYRWNCNCYCKSWFRSRW